MLLDWRTVQNKMPWDVVLLLGGGFALAESTEVIEFFNISAVFTYM